MARPFEEIVFTEEVDARLEIVNPDGGLALYATTAKVILKDNLDERWIATGSDGKIELVSVHPGEIDEEVELSGGGRFRIRYSPPLRPGQYTFETTTKFIDSFLEQQEYFALTIKHQIRRLRFEIKFPPNVPVTSASVIRFDPSPSPTATQVQEAPPSLTFENNSHYVLQW